ncbi:MAG: hypothetical protein V4721_00555 [Bacteroidota bacterium]
MDKIKLKDADKQKPKLIKKTMRLNPEALAAKKQQVAVLESQKAQPLHSLIADYQHEAVLTLVDLMRNSSSDPVRRASASELLGLGGNAPEFLKLQAIMSGRNKDASQMTTSELEKFVEDARRELAHKMEFAANGAIVVNAEPTTAQFDPNLNINTLFEAMETLGNDDPTTL